MTTSHREIAKAAAAHSSQAPQAHPSPRPQASRAEWLLGFLAVLLQVAALFVVMRRFQVENTAFIRLTMLAFGGFAVHALLPMRWRLPFFVALSLGALFLVIGPANAAAVLALGLTLVGIVRLPLPFKARVALLLLAAGVLALLRSGIFPAPWSVAVWPILASMFMFRMIIYLYDLRHDKTPPSWTRTLAYFFMLPNVCFPLFPVVDYKTFRRTHYDGEEIAIYQRGVHWMARGIAQMLLYRLVYFNFTIDPYDVTDLPTLTQFLFTNFALYLRLSGQFHMIVGMLHLFGFHLPETNHLYWLSTSVSDFWRRINIYWKDFMMKVFYYPLVFAMKGWKPAQALVAGTLAVFAITWALHLYQWFWLRGALFFSAPDMAFWTILAILVAVNSLYEARAGARRGAAARSWTLRTVVLSALRASAVFVTICLLWALWTSASLSDWVALLAVVRPADATKIALGAAALVAAMALAKTAEHFWERRAAAKIAPRVAAAPRPSLAAANSPATTTPAGASTLASPASTARRSAFGFVTPAFARSAAPAVVMIALLAALTHRPLTSRFGAPASDLVESLRVARMSTRDIALMERGYYEKLFGVNSLNSELWELYMKRPYWPRLQEIPAARETHDFANVELVPNTNVDWHGAPLHVNRWGMRDRDYEKAKEPDVYRIACLGASYLMAGGVDEEATFENVAEQSLNAPQMEGENYPRVEMLNFGIDGYSSLERLAALEDRVLPFQPDAVFCFPQTVEKQVAVHRLEVMLRDGIDLRYDGLRALATRAGVDRRTGPKHARQRLDPLGAEILQWSYDEFVRVCRAHGVRPVWIFMPRVMERESEQEIAELEQMARAAGFEILSLADTFDGQNVEALHLAPWDFHPNREGHALLGRRLYEEIRESGILPALDTRSAVGS